MGENPSQKTSNRERIRKGFLLVAKALVSHFQLKSINQSWVRLLKVSNCQTNKQHLLFLHMTFSCALSSQTTDHYTIATQHAQSAWQGHAFQTLFIAALKSQALQTIRQRHAVQTLVELKSKSQFLQTVRQGHAFQALVELRSKSQILQTVRQGHACQTLVECMTTIKSFNPSVSNALPKCRAVAPFLFPSQYHCVVWVSALPQKVLLCEPCF